MRTGDFKRRHQPAWRCFDAYASASRSSALAAQIEIDHVAQAVEADVVIGDCQFRRTQRLFLRQSSLRAEVFDVTVAVELQTDAGGSRAVGLQRSNHEGQIEPCVA